MGLRVSCLLKMLWLTRMQDVGWL